MITASAIIARNGDVITLPAPNRHCHVIWYMVDALKHKSPIIGEQGFINDKGEYLNRREAKIEAMRCNQIIKRDYELDELYSEDVW